MRKVISADDGSAEGVLLAALNKEIDFLFCARSGDERIALFDAALSTIATNSALDRDIVSAVHLMANREKVEQVIVPDCPKFCMCFKIIAVDRVSGQDVRLFYLVHSDPKTDQDIYIVLYYARDCHSLVSHMKQISKSLRYLSRSGRYDDITKALVLSPSRTPFLDAQIKLMFSGGCEADKGADSVALFDDTLDRFNRAFSSVEEGGEIHSRAVQFTVLQLIQGLTDMMRYLREDRALKFNASCNKICDLFLGISSRFYFSDYSVVFSTGRGDPVFVGGVTGGLFCQLLPIIQSKLSESDYVIFLLNSTCFIPRGVDDAISVANPNELLLALNSLQIRFGLFEFERILSNISTEFACFDLDGVKVFFESDGYVLSKLCFLLKRAHSSSVASDFYRYFIALFKKRDSEGVLSISDIQSLMEIANSVAFSVPDSIKALLQKCESRHTRQFELMIYEADKTVLSKKALKKRSSRSKSKAKPLPSLKGDVLRAIQGAVSDVYRSGQFKLDRSKVTHVFDLIKHYAEFFSDEGEALLDLKCPLSTDVVLRNSLKFASVPLVIWGVMHGLFPLVQALLDIQPDFINHKFEPQGSTLLHVAAANGDLEMMYYLLDRGEKPNILNDNNESVLVTFLLYRLSSQFASISKDRQMAFIRFLLERSSNVPELLNSSNPVSPLCLMVSYGFSDKFIEDMLKMGANARYRTRAGDGITDYVSKEASVVRLLMAYGATESIRELPICSGAIVSGLSDSSGPFNLYDCFFMFFTTGGFIDVKPALRDSVEKKCRCVFDAVVLLGNDSLEKDAVLRAVLDAFLFVFKAGTVEGFKFLCNGVKASSHFSLEDIFLKTMMIRRSNSMVFSLMLSWHTGSKKMVHSDTNDLLGCLRYLCDELDFNQPIVDFQTGRPFTTLPRVLLEFNAFDMFSFLFTQGVKLPDCLEPLYDCSHETDFFMTHIFEKLDPASSERYIKCLLKYDWFLLEFRWAQYFIERMRLPGKFVDSFCAFVKVCCEVFKGDGAEDGLPIFNHQMRVLFKSIAYGFDGSKFEAIQGASLLYVLARFSPKPIEFFILYRLPNIKAEEIRVLYARLAIELRGRPVDTVSYLDHLYRLLSYKGPHKKLLKAIPPTTMIFGFFPVQLFCILGNLDLVKLYYNKMRRDGTLGRIPGLPLVKLAGIHGHRDIVAFLIQEKLRC